MCLRYPSLRKAALFNSELMSDFYLIVSDYRSAYATEAMAGGQPSSYFEHDGLVVPPNMRS